METTEKATLTPAKIIDTFLANPSKDIEERRLIVLDYLVEDFISQDGYNGFDKVIAFDLYRRVRQLLADVKYLQSQKGGNNE